MVKSVLENMTVTELRKMTKKVGLPQQKDGKKFTKPELIENLLGHNKDFDELAEEPKEEEAEQKEEMVTEEKTEIKEDIPTLPIVFANTLEEIKKKYGVRKEQRIYDEELKVGCFIVYLRDIEINSNKTIQKLSTAKVIAKNARKELVRLETPIGKIIVLPYNELLYIRSINETRWPKDIHNMLRKQRIQSQTRFDRDRNGML